MMDSEQHVPLFSGVTQSSTQDVVSISKVELDTEEILATREIPWEIYSTARLINDLELHLLRRYDNKRGGPRGSWGSGSPSTSARLSSRLPSSSSLHRWRLLCGEVRCVCLLPCHWVGQRGMRRPSVHRAYALPNVYVWCVDTMCRMGTSIFRQC